ncbi:MAG: dienelactone hydrolase family protein [Alphaproteobacteria bacterium]|nr:dienelactone hydrolase family protein [Alphaproteobacteria bacterium]
MGRMIEIDVGGAQRMGAYLAEPEGGKGPGFVLVQEIFGVNPTMKAHADLFAEEGYTVLVPDLFHRLERGVSLGYDKADFDKALGFLNRFDVDKGVADLGAAIAHLRSMPATAGKAGIAGFCLGGRMTYLVAARHSPDVAVAFYGGGIDAHIGEASRIRCPIQLHFGATDHLIPMDAVERIKASTAKLPNVKCFVYQGAGHGFYNHDRSDYHRPSAMVAHSRAVAALRAAMGPSYDLEALWDRHLDMEFATRDTDKTMATMVAKPYVNHVPTMTGGTGAAELRRFYANHFIPQMPKDTHMIPISRTVGTDRVIDEMIFCFTHDQEIDWMLPGIKPTGRKVEIPLIAVVNFRGSKLYHEHIYWDQASVLVQIGALDPKGLPVAGIETARKVVDETQPSNTLMARWKESAGR